MTTKSRESSEERVAHTPQQKDLRTPTPWSFHRTHEQSQNRWYVITDAHGYGPVVEVGGADKSGQIAEAKYLITDPQIVEANAAFIVTACNAHEALVGALQGCLNTLRYFSNNNDLSKYDCDLFAEVETQARAALSLATQKGDL